MNDILPLSTVGHLPLPVLKDSPPRADSAEEEALGGSPRAVPAAYQALPVTGSLITHNYTPSQPVLDADDLDKQVRQPPRSVWVISPCGGLGRRQGPAGCPHAAGRGGTQCWGRPAAADAQPPPRGCGRRRLAPSCLLDSILADPLYCRSWRRASTQ